MVDKTTARALVYGVIGTLMLLLLIAVVALSSRSTLQAKLDVELKRLADKEREAKEQEKLARKASGQAAVHNRKAKDAEREKERLEQEAKAKREEFNNESTEKEEAKKDAKELRREHRKVRREEQKRSHVEDPIIGPQDDEEKDEAEYLSSLSDEELEKQLADEAKSFEQESRDLGAEKLDDEDNEDLAREVKKAEELANQTKLVLNMKGSKEAAKEMERLIELGEQNEVYLEDLKRDARRDAKLPHSKQKWHERSRPGRMERLAHQMDARAEELRHRSEKNKLKNSEGNLSNIESLAHATLDKPFDKQVSGMVEELESEERREERLMNQGDDEIALKQATALEEYARAVQDQVDELERTVSNNPNMSQTEKDEHNKVLELLEKELVNIEATATEIEQAYERRQMRLGTVELSKEANALYEQDETMHKLNRSGGVYNKVGKMLQTEWDLLKAMKNVPIDPALRRQKQELVEKLAHRLTQENGVIEEEARKLLNEVEAHKFKMLEEKLESERIVRDLHRKADDMQSAASTIEHDDERRRLLEEAQDMRRLAVEVAKGDPKVAKAAKKVVLDLSTVASVMRTDDLSAQVVATSQAMLDLTDLTNGIHELVKDMNDPKSEYTEAQKKEIKLAIKEMEAHAKKIREELRLVDVGIKEKAQDEVHRVEKERERLKKLQEGGSQPNVGGKR